MRRLRKRYIRHSGTTIEYPFPHVDTEGVDVDLSDYAEVAYRVPFSVDTLGVDENDFSTNLFTLSFGVRPDEGSAH